MFSFSTIVLSLSLLASQTLAAPNASGPSKHARWVQTPRTLLDPDFLKRDNLEARDVGFSPFEKKDIFQRQTGSCNPGEVECRGNKCCPAGFNCYYVGEVAACCRVGQTCSGLPVGCADPNSLECPASVGGCCPIGQACYRDSAGVARCDNTGLYSSSVVVTTPTYTSPAYTPPAYTAPTYTPPTVTTPTYTPPFTTPTTSTDTTKNGNTGPATVTVAGIRSGAEKMAIGMGALTVMTGALVALA